MLNNLTLKKDICTFSVCPENPTGKKGEGGKATLEEGSVSVLEALLAAIDEYESDFVNEYVWDVDQDDLVLGDRENTATYKIPVSPIVIQSMKVTKY